MFATLGTILHFSFMLWRPFFGIVLLQFMPPRSSVCWESYATLYNSIPSHIISLVCHCFQSSSLFVSVICTISEVHLWRSPFNKVSFREFGWPSQSGERTGIRNGLQYLGLSFCKQRLHDNIVSKIFHLSTIHPPRDNYPEAKMPASHAPPTTRQSTRNCTNQRLWRYFISCTNYSLLV